ncbi:MAG: DNA-3-methyladenine glycosylase family protein [Chloroflexia bacterium]
MPTTPIDREIMAAAEAHLAAADPVLAAMIASHGPCTLAVETNHFASLVDAIISQQISVRAADSILRRLTETVPAGTLSPDAIMALTEAEMRAAGLSGAKVASIRDLASRIVAGTLDLPALDAASDDEVIAALLPVRGIGRWTAEMYLIFVLGRLDVLPVGDFGFRQSVSRRYKLPIPPNGGLPTGPTLTALAESWRPYRSVATWYFWKCQDPA